MTFDQIGIVAVDDPEQLPEACLASRDAAGADRGTSDFWITSGPQSLEDHPPLRQEWRH